MKKERWASVPGWSRYRISSLGRIRSKTMVVRYRDGRERRYPGKMLSTPTPPEGKYVIVGLTQDGKTRYEYLHRLVALAFVPNPKKLPEVNHKDLNKGNNRASNLEWVSSSKNKKHAVENGVKFNPNPKKGEDAGTAKVTWKIVRYIRSNPLGLKQRELGRMFGITQANVSEIVRNKTWKENQDGLTLPKGETAGGDKPATAGE